MRDYLKFYVNGQWVSPTGSDKIAVINPATEKVAGHISAGTTVDVDNAVAAARNAFTTYSRLTREARITLLERILQEYQKRLGDMAAAITEEMGAPAGLAQGAHAPIGVWHLATGIEVLKNYKFEENRGTTRILKEPIGVCGLITPWNWPINQIAAKVVPALATGCTIVLKPSEAAPFSAQIWTEILHSAGVPKGVFNLIHGSGPVVGAAISSHPGVDMVSFTGSTRAGVEVARAAAPSVKRVSQELGGKSPNIILEDADLSTAVTHGVQAMMINSGQSCNAPSRMLVHKDKMVEALIIAKKVAESIVVGDPTGAAHMGPVVNKTQFEKIQLFIKTGIEEGATLVAGGLGRPDGLHIGYYVRPTVFGNVTNEMTIAREEIFGPVLAVLSYESDDDAVKIGNATEYGLSSYVSGSNRVRIADVISRLRAGQVVVNGAPPDMMAPFGGYKKSGNGREGGDHGFSDYLEMKAVLGLQPDLS